MRKIVYVCVVAIALVFFAHAIYAEECHMTKKGWFGMGAKEQGSKMGDMQGMMMKKMMMEKKMIATSDGGVIVMFGNKLVKYDKDLELVKEVELKIDMEAMKKCMKQCHEMMKKPAK